MLTRFKQLGAALAAVVLMAGTAQAAPVIDFQTGNAGAGGTITWDGTNLIGTNIPIGGISVLGAPTGNGTNAVSGSASGQGPDLYGDMDFNTAQNFITITGCIWSLGIGTESGGCIPEILLEGTFQGWTVSNHGLLSAAGIDTKNDELLAAIGVPSDIPWAFFGFSLTADDLQPNGVPATVISTDIKNTAIPEPTTMMLLGTGLLAAFRARRRQQA